VAFEDDTAEAQACADTARSGTAAPTPFAVYVAAGSGDVEAARVAAAIATLRSQGFIVTSTWPDVVAANGGGNPRNASHEQRRGWTTQDLNEIDAADAIWFLVPSPPSTTRGAWFEAGYAYSEKKHLLFSGDTKQSVFCALGIEFETDAAAIAYLHQLRVERGLRELEKNAPVSHADEWPNLHELGGEGG
jgi:hypothetical protein